MRISADMGSLIIALLIAAAVPEAKDFCHVYVVDVARARQALEKLQPTGNDEADAKALSAGLTIFPEFQPKWGEEELTTRHYAFPNTKLTITASVYYTDESLSSRGTGEFAENDNSIVIGVTAGSQKKPDAISPASGENAVAEATYDEYTNKLRARKAVTVAGRLYILGIECECHRK
jgi:hypothetical protein